MAFTAELRNSFVVRLPDESFFRAHGDFRIVTARISAMTTGAREPCLQMNIIFLKIFRKEFHFQVATHTLVLFDELFADFGQQITTTLIKNQKKMI